MALVPCPNCGHPISDSAVQCPNCGSTLNGGAAPSVMKSNPEIRRETFEVMKGNYGVGILIFLIEMGISLLSQIMYGLPTVFLLWPFSFGAVAVFLKLVRDGKALSVGDAFCKFKSPIYWKGVLLYLLMYVYTVLWTMLFIVPGIIKGLSYSLAPYILDENPDLTPEQAIQKSMRMMDGHKMQFFLLQLGYLGICMASILLLCVPLLWITPYYMAAYAKFYESVKANYKGE